MAKRTAKKKKGRTRLSELEAKEVSLVPVGQNNRKILVTKSAEDGEEPMDEILKQVLEGDLEGEAKLDELFKEGKVSPDQSKLLKGAMRLLKQAKGVPEDVMQKLGKLCGINKEAEPAPEKSRDEVLEELRKEGFKIEEPKTKEEPMDPEVKKELDAVRKEFSSKVESIEKERDSLKEDLAKERDLRMTREFTEKAESFGYKGEEAKEVATILKSASESMGEDEYKKLETRMKASVRKEGMEHLFKEHGSSATGDKTVEKKLEEAREAISKENKDWTPEQCEEEALRRDPALYNEYLDANPKQGGR